MSAELRQRREQRDALDALAEALRTRYGWLSYWVEALRDQLLELKGQATARPSAIERIRTALIDRDEALQQARGGVWRSARGSWRRSPSKAGPRRGRERPSRGPRRPKN
jgi:hypothetical protein